MLQESNHSRAVRRRLPIAAVLCLALVFAIVPSIALAGPLGDITAPESSSDREATYVEPAVIHITAIDPPGALLEPITGVKSITYIVDGGAPVVVLGASATVTVTEPGLHTLSFFAEDNDLNIEDPIDTTFFIEEYDLYPPVTVSDREDAYIDSGVITLTATDDVDGFGVDATYWILDAAPAVEGTVIAFDEFGHHTLSFWSTDLAGNVEVPIETYFYVFDTLPPVTTSDALPSYADAATITLSPSDGNGSGVTDTWYILDDGAAVQGTSITVSTDGDHTLEFWSVDAEGNVEAMQTVSFGINLVPDVTAPVSTSDAVANYATSPASIGLTSTDEEGGSGIASLFYRLDGGAVVVVVPSTDPPTPGTLVNPITPTIPAAATHHNSGDDCGGCHTGGCAECHGVGPAPAITTADPEPASHAFMTVTPCASCHVISPAATPMSITTDVIVSGLGAHAIEFWGEDVANNEETPHKTVAFTIGPVDTVAPVITVTGVANGATYTAPVTITFSALDAVDGPVAATATLDSAAFASGSTVSALGAHTLVVNATDAAGNPATRTITFTVSAAPPVNVAPVLTSIGSMSVSELALFAFTATATDGNGDTLTYSLTGAPSGASITSGGAFTWTPTEAQGPGSYTITVVVSDGALTDSEAVHVTVAEVNAAPVLASIGPKSLTLGQTLTFTASAIDVDLPANTKTFSLGMGAPTGAAITSGGLFSWTPSAAGTFSVTVRVSDGTATDTETITVTVAAPPGLVVLSIEGPNRFATAIAASQKAFSSSEYVIIATGMNWPDALGGSALAGALDAPILLTRQDVLPAEVRSEIVRLGATKAIILGGPPAVSAAVAGQIDAISGVSVERIFGPNRYDTANAVAARAIAVLGEDYEGHAFVATGLNFPDALAASPLAAGDGIPIYLANPAWGNNAGLVSVMMAAGVEEALVLGGTNVVSASIEAELNLRLDFTSTRYAGANRYETAIKVAQAGVDWAGLGWDKVAIATGENFPDALSGGVLQGKDGSVLLLTPTNSLNANVAAKLTANKASIHEVRFLGSTAAVSAAVRTAVTNILQN